MRATHRPAARAIARAGAIVSFALATAACNPALPEPESAGAQLYETRCTACHRLYPPNVMTTATWQLMLKRMQGEMQRRGIAPLNAEESKVLLDYLSRHALNAGERNDQG